MYVCMYVCMFVCMCVCVYVCVCVAVCDSPTGATVINVRRVTPWKHWSPSSARNQDEDLRADYPLTLSADNPPIISRGYVLRMVAAKGDAAAGLASSVATVRRHRSRSLFAAVICHSCAGSCSAVLVCRLR